MRLLVLLLSFIPFLLAAQQYQVTGKVTDSESEEPLPFATVSLLNAQDNSLITGAVTESDGSFTIPAEEGSYTVRVQFVTYQMTEIAGVTLNASTPTYKLGPVNLAPSNKELEEVVVQAERTQMQLSLDKKVYNVGKDLSNMGGSASDMLDNLPSVAVDVDGNVQLRGSSNVKILIDGRPSGLVGLSSTDALSQLQSNLIESVEIITNPSARYDAEGQAGIINIILKKDQQKGLNGSFQVSTGYPHNHGAGINMNLRRKWINVFVNYGFDYSQAPGTSFTNQQFFTQDSTYYTDQLYDRLRGGFSHNIRFGADFNVGENSTLTTSFLYRASDQSNLMNLSFEDYDANRVLGQYTLREDEENEEDNNLEYSLNYVRNFKRKGHNFTANVQYQDNSETELSTIEQTSGANSREISDILYQNVGNRQGEERLMLQADYIRPVGDAAKFELGYRSTFRNIRNDYFVEESPDGEVFTQLDTFTFDFMYKEYVHAFYGIFSDELDKFSWQLGLRSEVSDIEASISGVEDKQFYDYINFFPSAFLTYNVKNMSQIQVSYSRRINRPRYRDLSPLSSFTNNRSFRVGNPELQPEYTDSYEVGYLQNFKNSSIYYGVYYRHTNDPIQRVSRPAENGNVTVSIEENLGLQKSMGIEVNANQDFTDWYRLSGNFNFFRQEILGSAYGEDLNATAFSFSTRISNNLKIKDLLTAQININYRAPEQRSQGVREAITVLDIGLSKDLWNKKGTLTLSARDVFNSRKYRFTTETANFISDSEWQWRRGPQFVLTLNYRLNQDFGKKERRGGEDKPGDGIRKGFDGGNRESDY